MGTPAGLQLQQVTDLSNQVIINLVFDERLFKTIPVIYQVHIRKRFVFPG
jgi:hypothetical protein